MNSVLIPLASPSASQLESLDLLLRRATAYCWLHGPTRRAAKGAVTVSYDQIGETAGAVWEVLSKDGPLTFAALMETVNVPQSLFFMAIGWLSREEKLQFESAGGDYVVRLA